MRKMLELTDIKLFLEECEKRLRNNCRDVGFFVDTVRYLVLIAHFGEEGDIDRLISILNKYLSGRWKTEMYDHEEDFFVALNGELLDLLDEIEERAYEERGK
jgi:hypothetical protein